MGKESDYFLPYGRQELDSAYKVLYHLYEPVINQPRTEKCGYIPLIHTPLSQIPFARDYEKIVGWVNSTMRYIPREIFADPELQPTSHLHVQAILANVLNRQREQEPKLAQEVFIPQLLICCALVPYGFQVGQDPGLNGTTDTLRRYFSKKKLTHRNFANLLTELLVQSVPYHIDEKKEYQRGIRKLKRRIKVADQRGQRRFNTVIPSRFWDHTSFVFFRNISSNPVITPATIDRNTDWYQQVGAAGLYMPPDTYAKIPLNVHSSSGAKLVGDQVDATGDTAASLVTHEKMHEQKAYLEIVDPSPTTDFELMMFELVTDSAAVIEVMNGHRIKDGLRKSDWIGVGYSELRKFAGELVRQHVFTSEEIVYYGSHQLWLQFYRNLCSRLHQIPPSAYDPVISILLQEELISVETLGFYNLSKELHDDPDTFLRTKFQEQINKNYGVIPKDFSADGNEIARILKGKNTDRTMKFVAMADTLFRRQVDIRSPLIQWRYGIYIDLRFVEMMEDAYLQKKDGVARGVNAEVVRTGLEEMLAEVDPQYKQHIAAKAYHYADRLYRATEKTVNKFLEAVAPSYRVTEKDMFSVCSEIIPVWYKKTQGDFQSIPEFIRDFNQRLRSFMAAYGSSQPEPAKQTTEEAEVYAQRALKKMIFFAKVIDQLPMQKKK